MKSLAILLLLLVVASSYATQLPSTSDASLLKEVSLAQERGLDWLLKQQEKDGSWRNHPAITALAVTAYLRFGKPLTGEQHAAVERGLKYILNCVKPSGAIFGGGETDRYPNYSTAICTMALLATGKPEYADTIRNARDFLLSSQFDEAEHTPPNDPSYGGIGYGRRERPDLSNTSWALEALRLIESRSPELQPQIAPRDDLKLHWTRAIAFLQRCQNLPSHNDQPWAKNAGDRDLGGFIYMPGFSFANEGETVNEKTPLRSYGSMSYAGLKSYIYADLKRDDPRVVAAVNWLKHNYTLEENPGLGKQGLYYYYHTFAKALTAYGEDTFTDAAGKVHDWRYDLMNKLVRLQKHDGFWINEDNRWWENDPVLVTCYSLLALEILQQRRYP
jgi:squalene-hopene/tetraprenyl-beta-curcumene cyclase